MAGFLASAFSVAGRRGGFADIRGTLFFDIARIAKHHRTPYLLLENVRGLLSHDKGRTFGTILSTLDGLGYDLQWQVLNSKDFGVPQNRERVIIVGHTRSRPRPEVFPLGSDDSFSAAPQPEVYENTRAVHSNYSKYEAVGSHILQDIRGLKKQQNGKGWKPATELAYTVDTFGTQGISYALDTNYFKGILANQKRTGAMQNGLIRRLTPVECERLQGFPDNWTAGVSDTQRYKQMGNAVTTNVIEAVARCLPIAI